MEWQFRNDIPIYTQLVEQIKQRIVSGVFTPGQRLPAVREFALDAGVNPNTMQRALAELERDGLVHSQRTTGRFVTDDAALIGQLREELAGQQLRQFFRAMAELGYQREQIMELVRRMDTEEAHYGDTGM